MYLVDGRSLLACADDQLEELIAAIASGQDFDPLAYCVEIGTITDLTEGPASAADPFADILVVEDGDVFAMRPAVWLDYVAQVASGAQPDLAAYGGQIGTVAANLTEIEPAAASALRRALLPESSYIAQPRFAAA